MPGGPQYVQAYNRPAGNRLFYCFVFGILQAQAKRPFSAPIVLRLYRAKPFYKFFGLFKNLPGNMLIVKPLFRDVGVCHTILIAANVQTAGDNSLSAVTTNG